jgi:hypothetical protein
MLLSLANFTVHVNTIKYADRVLPGMSGWEPMVNDPADSDSKSSASAGAKKLLRQHSLRATIIANCRDSPVTNPRYFMYQHLKSAPWVLTGNSLSI